jgi:hypothetical protein
MEPEGSLAYSQVPATRSYPELLLLLLLLLLCEVGRRIPIEFFTRIAKNQIFFV